MSFPSSSSKNLHDFSSESESTTGVAIRPTGSNNFHSIKNRKVQRVSFLDQVYYGCDKVEVSDASQSSGQ